METDAAELSSMMSVLADVANRLDGLADRRAADPDDPTTPRLQEIARSLSTAERRLRALVRDLS